MTEQLTGHPPPTGSLRPRGPARLQPAVVRRARVTPTEDIIATAGRAVDLAACLDHRALTPVDDEPAPPHRPSLPRLAAAPPAGPRR